MNIPRSVFVSGVLRLTIANGISQCISLVGLLILSRLYTAEQVGAWALFMTVGIFLPLFAGMRYDIALVFARTGRTMRALVTLITLISVSLSLFSLVVYALWREFASESWLPYSAFIGGYAVHIFAWGFFNVGNSIAMQRNHYRLIAINRILLSVITIILQVLLVSSNLFGNGLIAGTVLTMVLSGGLFTVVYRRDYYAAWRPILHRQGWNVVRIVARTYKAFPLYTLPHSLVSNAHMQITMFAIGAWYGLANLGQFNLAYRTLYTPMTMVNNGLSQVLMPRFSKVRTQPELMQHLFITIIRMIGYLICFPLALVSVWGADMYALVFGEHWHLAGIFAAVQVPAIFAVAVTLWMERIFDALNRQRLHLMLSIGLNLLTLLLFVAAHELSGEPLITTLAWSAGMLLYAGVWLAVAFRVCDFSLHKLAHLIVELAAIISVLIGALALIHTESTGLIELVLVMVTATLFAFLMWRRLKDDALRLWQS
jgi:O-antigen/teichoic acid export membrane protein